MVRRRYRRSGGGFGLGGGSMIKKAVFGLAAGYLVSKVLGSDNTLVKGGAGYLAGGMIGAVAGAFGTNLLAGMTGGSADTSGAAF